MSLRNKAACFIKALQLMLRVLKLSRETGIPFKPLLQAHLDTMENMSNYVSQEVYEHQVAEIARNN